MTRPVWTVVALVAGLVAAMLVRSARAGLRWRSGPPAGPDPGGSRSVPEPARPA